jgi:glycosyltransferase involved in cell wall biosynthesis
MSKYPRALFFRYDKYEAIDKLIFTAKAKLDCEIIITRKCADLQNLYDVNCPILVTYGNDRNEYLDDVNSVIRKKNVWLHFSQITDIKEFSREINKRYIENIIGAREDIRPTFSAFTTCYNSYEKIERPLRTLLAQTLLDWEWVVLDDSPDDRHFQFLKEKFAPYKKIRLFKRSENSGNIGNVKNEAASLCRGRYVLELDHDDEIVPELFQEATDAFTKYPDAGFVYGETINLFENKVPHFYGDFIALGYGGYYCEFFQGQWVNVYVTPQLNNITMSHLVSLPNHPRIWRRDTLYQLGNYCEHLPINDDQEILMRTILNTKCIKIPKILYIQYMNENNNNFSLIRNSEINRIGPNFLVPQFYSKYDVHKRMAEKGAHDRESLLNFRERVWLRTDFKPEYSNEIYQPHYDTQYCIVGTDAFFANLEHIRELYENPRNDFFFIDSHGIKNDMKMILQRYEFFRMKYYTIKGLSEPQMINYFHYLYRTCQKFVILSNSN